MKGLKTTGTITTLFLVGLTSTQSMAALRPLSEEEMRATRGAAAGTTYIDKVCQIQTPTGACNVSDVSCGTVCSGACNFMKCARYTVAYGDCIIQTDKKCFVPNDGPICVRYYGYDSYNCSTRAELCDTIRAAQGKCGQAN